MATVYKRKSNEEGTPSIKIPTVKLPVQQVPILEESPPVKLPVLLAFVGAALLLLAVPGVRSLFFPPIITETGTVVYFSRYKDACPVGRTPDDLKALGKTAQMQVRVNGELVGGAPTPYEPISLAGLMQTGRVFFVHQRTKVGVLEKADGLIRVKILSGVHEGQTGWVAESAYRRPGEPDNPPSDINVYNADGTVNPAALQLKKHLDF